MLMRCLAQDTPDLSPLYELSKQDQPYVEGLVWNMLTKVRGSSREALVAWLDDMGLIDLERDKIYSRSAVRRALAAERLGNAGVPRTARAVIRLLSDRRDEVRIVAARSLGKLGQPGAIGPLLNSLDGERTVPMSLVTMALLHMGPSVVEPLIPFLGSNSPNVRAVGAELLGMHGAIGASKWLTLLVANDPENDVRVRAANALGRIGSPHGIEALIRATSVDNSVALRNAAVLALGQIGGSAALGAMQNALNDPDEQVSSTAAEALSGLGRAGADILAIVAETESAGQRQAVDWLARAQLGPSNRRRRVSAEV